MFASVIGSEEPPGFRRATTFVREPAARAPVRRAERLVERDQLAASLVARQARCLGLLARTVESVAESARVLRSSRATQLTPPPGCGGRPIEDRQPGRIVGEEAVIEQAKGWLVRAVGCHPDEALRLLVSHGQEVGRAPRDLAEELVNASIHPPSR